MKKNKLDIEELDKKFNEILNNFSTEEVVKWLAEREREKLKPYNQSFI